MNNIELKENIRKEIEQMAELEEGSLAYDDKFAEKGIDSFLSIQLIAMLEDDHDIVIPDDRLAELTSVNEVARVIEELRK